MQLYCHKKTGRATFRLLPAMHRMIGTEPWRIIFFFSLQNHRMFSSISMTCLPVVVRRFFRTVSNVVLLNHSLKVAITNLAARSPLILYWKAMFQAKFLSAICVTFIRLLMCTSVRFNTC